MGWKQKGSPPCAIWFLKPSSPREAEPYKTVKFPRVGGGGLLWAYL